MTENESLRSDDNPDRSPAATEPVQGFRDIRHYVPQDILDVSFPVSMRGYDRHAVDAYIKRVNRVIAEVKVSASPPAAVRHALDQAQEKVEALLQAAREAAEEITTSARREAEESTARTKAEAADLMVNTTAEADRVTAEAEERLANARAEAEAVVAKANSDANDIVSEATTEAQENRARARSEAEERRRQLEDELTSLEEQGRARMDEIRTDTEKIRSRRSQILDDLHATAAGLVELADAAAARVQPDEPSEEATPGMARASRDESTPSATTQIKAAEDPTLNANEHGGEAGDTAEERTSSSPAT
jgi:DivIVA domain-containing protein